MESPSKVVAKSANTLAEIESTTDETEEVEEFVDAMDVSFGSESYIYDANVQIVDIKDDNIDDQKEMALTDIALMLCSTLASEYDGASVPRLHALFLNDWNIRLDVRSVELGFADFEALLKSENVEHFVEQAALIKGVPYYRAVCFPLTEHILRRVAECKLEEYQKAEKRKKKKMMDLKNPENEENFIEGKRRILNILLDLKAYETDVDYQKIRDEYMKRYNTSLNAAEQQRLFLNRSAMKNFWRAFHREVILTNDNPIHLRLRSQDIKIPDEITEEDRRLVANIDNIELPKFDLPYRSPVSYLGRKASEHLESIVSQDGDACCQKEAKISMPTMDWGEEVEEEDEMKTNAEGECASTFEKICIANKTLYDDDKYTGDEESTDSSDSKMDAFGQYRKKKIKTRINTFNIPSKSSTSHPSLAKRLPVAGRSLELSLNYLNMKQSNLSGALASDTFNDRNSTATFQQTSYSSSQPPKLNQRRIKYCCGTEASKNLCVDHSGPAVVDLSDEEELSKAVYGSYSVPKLASNPLNQNEDFGEQRHVVNKFSAEKCQDNHRRPLENFPTSSWSSANHHSVRDNGGEQIRTYQSNHFRQHDIAYAIASHESRNISAVESSIKLSEGTQTDDEWLEQLFGELGLRNPATSALQKLADVVEMLVDVRSPNPVLLSALPQIVGLFYGSPVDPENDQCYRTTWRALIANHCSKILIAPLPNGEEVLIKR